MKRSLRQERATLGKSGWAPKCGYCDKPIRKHEGLDLHESFITRGDIWGRQDLAPRIMVRENVSLVHHGECHVQAATEEGQRRIATHIAYWVGEDAIIDWLTSLEDGFVGTTITEAKNLVKELTYG